MKFHNKIIALSLAVSLSFSSCNNQEFQDLNLNPTAANDMDMDFLLATGILQAAQGRYESWRANLIYSSLMVQHLAATNWQGDKYDYSAEYTAALWDAYYPGAVKTLTWVLDNTAGDPEQINTHAAAKVMRVYVMQRLTDMYGDIPYFQGGRGYSSTEAWRPVYDKQEDIYADMVDELIEAAGMFDSGKDNFNQGRQDILFGGDLAKWEMFANSLLLRLGMRVSDVDAALTTEALTAALQGGVMTLQTHSAIVKHSDGPDGINRNGNSEVLTAGNGGDRSFKISKTFMDWLDSHNDPRKAILMVKGDPYDPNTWDTDPADQVALPNGMDDGANNDWKALPNLTLVDGAPSFQRSFSFINKNLWDQSDPMHLMTYAETAFLLAEIAQRGLGTTGKTAAQHYADGVKASMQQWVDFDANATVSDLAVTNYLAANPYNPATGLQQIGEQVWATHFFVNSIEGWYNWRRTGFPNFTPVNYPGNITGGVVPRRLHYPTGEAAVNSVNYAAAVASQGSDDFLTRVWWDN